MCAMPLCEQCGQAADYTVTIARGAYSVSRSSCGAAKCLFRGAAHIVAALALTATQNDLSSEHQNEGAPPESGRRRINHLRMI